jgi:hypothetical protein
LVSKQTNAISYYILNLDRNEGHGVEAYEPLPSKNSMQQIQVFVKLIRNNFLNTENSKSPVYRNIGIEGE